LEGLALLLNQEPDIEVLGKALTISNLLSLLPQSKAEIVILELDLPGLQADELLKKIKEIRPGQKLIYLSFSRSIRQITKLLKSGAQGFVLKSAPLEDLKKAISSVSMGGQYFSQALYVRKGFEDKHVLPEFLIEKSTNVLSWREKEILKLLCEEFNNFQIAKKLYISVSTVATHRKNIMAKTGVKNTVGLIKFAIKNSLMD
jgi:DNA-binding NarL/FixJ family response regulator